ncbi:hypothetical protein DDI_2712 [Dickeya dianthicola RNS04.9]|nr:hypothetical protein DDI_2712 [Dickeya dianthicola RNS04.9]
MKIYVTCDIIASYLTNLQNYINIYIKTESCSDSNLLY